MEKETYTTRDSCRSCSSHELVDVLSLGEHNLPEWSEQEVSPVKVPLELVLCSKCCLLQLRHTTRPDLLWNENYGYKSGVNATMRKHLRGIANSVDDIMNLRNGDIVVDIGCNDGTLLNSYPQKLGEIIGQGEVVYSPNILRVGFEPSSNVAREARESGIKVIPDFFNARAFKDKFGGRKAKVITAISMFYDLEEPNVFLQDVKEILDPDGILVIQQNYLAGMLEQTAFDNICHEHLEYYSLRSLEDLLKRNGLEVFAASENTLNGGSFRTYIQHRGGQRYNAEALTIIDAMKARERLMGMEDLGTYREFGDRVRNNVDELRALITGKVSNGKVVYVYGASTRGNTILQAAGLDNSLITAAAERNPAKYGKKIVGSGIPIVSEEEARAAKPDYFLVLPWHFRDEFIQREQEYLKSGGELIFPLPKLEIVSD